MINPLDQSSKPDIQDNASRKWIIRLFHTTVILLIGIAAWQYIDFVELFQAASKVRPEVIILLLAIATADRFLMAYKWRKLLQARHIDTSFWLVLGAYYQASFVGRVFPSITGDFLRGYIVTRRTGRWPDILGTMVIEKALAITASAAIATLGSVLLINELQQEKMVVLLIAPGAFAASILAIYISLSDQFSARIKRFRKWKKLRTYIHKLHDAYTAFSSEYRVLATNFGLALLENLFQIAILYLSAWAVGVNVDIWLLMAVLALSQMLRKFAIVLEGWVLGEFITVFTCTLAGISPTEALTFSLLATAIAFGAIIPGGLISLFTKKITPGKA